MWLAGAMMAWIALCCIVLVAWSRYWRFVRCLEGIDEVVHVEAL
jgi:hypothetical protein